jgi:hypothetical protein
VTGRRRRRVANYEAVKFFLPATLTSDAYLFVNSNFMPPPSPPHISIAIISGHNVQ